MAVDAAFYFSRFFGIRPAYYYLRQFIGETGFRMFKPRAGKGIPTGQEIMAAEQKTSLDLENLMIFIV